MLRRRRRGITYIEIVVAMSFVLICTATLTNSVTFSTEMIDYTQRRVIIQAALQTAIDQAKSDALVGISNSGTNTTSFTIFGSRTVTVTKTITKIPDKNLMLLQMNATWPESRGTRNFTDTMSFELYLRGPDA